MEKGKTRPDVKKYTKPKITKHKAVQVISGSGCSYYKASYSGGTYYY
jgi:hypothetical protein